MDSIFGLLGAVTGIVLIAAAFLYLVSPRRAESLIKRMGMVFVGFLLALAVIRLLMTALDPLTLFLIFAFLSLVAYLILRERFRREVRGTVASRVERTPVLPWEEPQ
ncbi:hypothetical protein MYX75_02245 [Acidobacteria bacterium AH-259-A15]|nr:hypothetical protein [Acidobacteria bacterium AH-259-A15]